MLAGLGPSSRRPRTRQQGGATRARVCWGEGREAPRTLTERCGGAICAQDLLDELPGDGGDEHAELQTESDDCEARRFTRTQCPPAARAVLLVQPPILRRVSRLRERCLHENAGAVSRQREAVL